MTVCPASNKHFLLCTECPKHMPTLQYLKDNHDPKIGWKNFTLMRGAFGNEAYKAMCAAVSVSVSLSDSTVPKVDKGVQVVLANSDHEEAIWKDAKESHQVEKLKLDRGCIITLKVMCVTLIGLMWYHVLSQIHHVLG